MLLGPSGLTLLSESRDNIYPLQRTFAGAIQRSLNNDVEPLRMYVLNIIQETRKLKNENVFLRKLTNQLSSESDKRFQIYNDQILFLKNVLKENGVIYASPTKKKKNATDNNNNNTNNNKSNTRMNTKDEISSFTKELVFSLIKLFKTSLCLLKSSNSSILIFLFLDRMNISMTIANKTIKKNKKVGPSGPRFFGAHGAPIRYEVFYLILPIF